ncbi:MAG: DUF4058 family protein [Planctomycetales bacterium]
MDPYLECRQLWTGVHPKLIVYLAEQLQPLLAPRYVASIEERVYVEAPARQFVPDLRIHRTTVPSALPRAASTALLDEPIVVEVPVEESRERYIEILDRQSDLRIVTVIEIVSPSNKHSGAARKSYLQKQSEILSSDSHLVEIDLLRTGQHVLAVPEWRARQEGVYDYLVSVNRAHESRTFYELYLRSVREPLPSVRIALSEGDPDVLLDLQAAFRRAWESGGYALRIDYRVPCIPPLSLEDQAWANALIAAATADDAPRTAAGSSEPVD